MARRSYSVGSAGARVTADQQEALQTVGSGLPVVLIGADGALLGELLRSSPDRPAHRRLLAVVVGDPGDPAAWEAAREMAAELWPGAAGPGDRTPQLHNTWPGPTGERPTGERPTGEGPTGEGPTGERARTRPGPSR